MRRKGVILVLAIGAISGFASGLYSCHYHGVERRQAFEDHIAEVCTRAAERSRNHAARAENVP